MEGLILDHQFYTLDMLDAFESFIWADRYCGYGDFEIFMPMSPSVPPSLVQDNYLSITSSDRLMIIEQIEMATDAETGTHLTISGRSLEALLERRIIWGMKTLEGNLQDNIHMLLNENAINPTDPLRKIPGLSFRPSIDPAITSLMVNLQLICDNLYDVIFILCDINRIGFRILPNGPGTFVFELYKGIDRSYNQTENQYVIFSPKFENLLTSNYFETKKLVKNAALVGGEGEGDEKVLIEAVPDSGVVSGLDRREIFVSSTTRSRDEDGEDISPEEYEALLKEDGKKAMAETKSIVTFEGEIDAQRQFIYAQDFFIGDIVQVMNEYGMEAQSRVSELVQTHNNEGETFIPTFTTVED